MKREIKFEGISIPNTPLIKQAYLKKESQNFISFLVTSLRSRQDKYGSIIMDIDKSARGALTQLRNARAKFAIGTIDEDEGAIIEIKNVGMAFYSNLNMTSSTETAGGIYDTIINTVTETALYVPPVGPGSGNPPILDNLPETNSNSKASMGESLANNIRVLDKNLSEQIAKIKAMISSDDFGEGHEGHFDEEDINSLYKNLLGLQSGVAELLAAVDPSKFDKTQMDKLNTYLLEYNELKEKFNGFEKSSALIFALYGNITKTANIDPRKATAEYLLKSAGVVDSFLNMPMPEVRPGVRIQEWKHDLKALNEKKSNRTNPLMEKRILARKAVNVLIEELKKFIRVIEVSSGKKNSNIEEKARWNEIIKSYNSFAVSFNKNLKAARSLGDLCAAQSIQHGIANKQLKNKPQSLVELPSAAMRSFKYVLPIPIPLINIKL